MTIGLDLDAILSNLQAQIDALQGGTQTTTAICFSGFKKLKIACRPESGNYEVSFNECILRSTSGVCVSHQQESLVINPITVGLNGLDSGVLAAGWYEIYVISNGSSVGGILVASGSQPVIPEGYSYSEFAGYAQVFSVSPLDLSQSMQYDDTVSIQDRGALSSTGVAATAMGVPQTLDISAYVPPKARFVSGFMGGRSGNRMQMAVMTYQSNQGIASDVGRRNAHGPAWTPSAGYDGFGMTENFENLMIENQTLYWKAGDTQAANILYISGYKL